jgi:hypothetical protein
MAQAQETLEVVRLWMTACATPMIALFGAYIAYQQHKIQKYRLVYDVSARRLAIFNVSRMLIIAGCSNKDTNDDSLFSFQKSTVEAPYLFRKKTVTYIEQIEERFKRMLALKDEINDQSDGQALELKNAKAELNRIRQSMRCELPILCEEFKPYLDLSSV